MYLFFEPHPGLMGCAKRLHEDIVRVLADMNGCRMSLATALSKIEAVKPDSMRLSVNFNDDKKGGWIGLAEGTLKNPPLHSWRLIRYSEKKDEDTDAK